MKTRIASAAVFVPAVLALLYLGGPTWTLAVAALAAIGGREMERMGRAVELRPAQGLAPIGAAGLVLAAGFTGLGAALVVQTGTIIAGFVDQLRRPDARRSVADWAFGVAAPAYVGMFMAYLAVIRRLENGLAWMLLLVVLVWVNDSAAYAGGRIWGNRPLAPTISPKKTWEGLASGTAGTMIAALVIHAGMAAYAGPYWLMPEGAIGVPGSAAGAALIMGMLGAVVALASPLGDLAKSFIKRQARVKDAGHLIPGHGGVLDRLDSLMFAAPTMYLAATALSRVN